MKIILVAIFSLFSVCHAYETENIAISDYEFRRYVRPQLKSISNEFQTLIFALNPELKDFKNIYTNIRSINRINQKIRRECKVSTKACSPELEKIEKELLKIVKGFAQAKLPESKDLGALMSWQHSKELLNQEALRLSQTTQNLLFQKEITGSLPSSLLSYSEELSGLYDRFNVFIYKASDDRFSNEINNFWVNFIKPVENFALLADNKTYFKGRITELNLVWHMLNVKLTKRSYKPNKQVSTLLNIMHRRWNNILKVSLKPRA